MKLRKLLVFSLILLSLVLPFVGDDESCAIGNPTSISMADVYIFKNVLVTGDQLWYCRYTVNYSPVPPEDPTTTYQMAIYDAGGTIVYFTRPLNYYQENIISIYLTSAQALTWSGAYIVRVMGNPAVFGMLTEGVNQISRTVGAGDYHEAADLAGVMTSQARILQTDWGISILTASDKLNATGSTYFIKAVPGLNLMVPSIFQTTTTGMTLPPAGSSNISYIQSEPQVRAGSRLRGAVSNISAIFGASEGGGGLFLASMVGLILASGVYGITKRPDWSIGIGLALFGVVGFMGVGTETLMTFVWVFLIVAALFILFWVGRNWPF